MRFVPSSMKFFTIMSPAFTGALTLVLRTIAMPSNSFSFGIALLKSVLVLHIANGIMQGRKMIIPCAEFNRRFVVNKRFNAFCQIVRILMDFSVLIK